MATNLDLNDELIEEARRVGHHKSKREAVTAALEAYVKQSRRLEILKFKGKVDFHPGYDHKPGRRKKRC